MFQCTEGCTPTATAISTAIACPTIPPTATNLADSECECGADAYCPDGECCSKNGYCGKGPKVRPL